MPTPRAPATTLPRRPGPPPPPPASLQLALFTEPFEPAERFLPVPPGAIRSVGFIIERLFTRVGPKRVHDGPLGAGASSGQPRQTCYSSAPTVVLQRPSTAPQFPAPRTPPTPLLRRRTLHRCLADDTTTRLSNQINSVSVNSSKTRSQSRHRVLLAASCVPVIKYLAYPRGGGAGPRRGWRQTTPRGLKGGREKVRGEGAERWIERGREGEGEGGRLPRRPEEGTTATNEGTKRAAGNQDPIRWRTKGER